MPHWQYGHKNRRTLFHHWHLCVSSEEIIPRRTIKKLLTKAAKEEHKCTNPTRIRLSYKMKDNCQSFLVYAFRIGKYKDNIILSA